MNNKIIFLTIFLLHNMLGQASYQRGLWVWSTSTVITSTTETNKLINQCINDETTDIYLYAYGMLTGINKTKVQAFISKARCNNINVWAMDGYRGYFADWHGRSGFINFINTVTAYNANSTVEQQFIGIQGDNEPQDGQGEPNSTFHNGIKGSLLSTTGGGVWQVTAALDREYLMRDWVDMTKEAYDTCHLHNLRYGQAMVSWLDDYYGEEIYCTYNSQYKPVVEHMMDYLDDFFIMSYNTNPLNVYARVEGELNYAETLPIQNRPRIWIGCETHCGVGMNVSYCDTPSKNSKDTVNKDISTIESLVTSYTSYTGFNIHDWEGWKNLTPISSLTTDPLCSNPTNVRFEIISNEEIQVYPNPSKGLINMNNIPENTVLEVFNIVGEVLFRKELIGAIHTINLPKEPDIYLLKFHVGETIQVKKILIE